VEENGGCGYFLVSPFCNFARGELWGPPPFPAPRGPDSFCWVRPQREGPGDLEFPSYVSPFESFWGFFFFPSVSVRRRSRRMESEAFELIFLDFSLGEGGVGPRSCFFFFQFLFLAFEFRGFF